MLLNIFLFSLLYIWQEIAKIKLEVGIAETVKWYWNNKDKIRK